MSTQIHIDELILHDFALPESHSITFERALTAELTRLLSASGEGQLPRQTFAAPHLTVHLPSGSATPMALGTQAAASVAALLPGTEAAP